MVYLDNSVFRQMISLVEKVPEECCGFLFGKESLSEKVMLRFYAAENITQGNRTTRYEISPSEYLAAENEAFNNKLQLLGIYHTHVNHPSIPSKVDRESAFPNLSYLIISVRNFRFSELRSWKLDDRLQFVEEKLILFD